MRTRRLAAALAVVAAGCTDSAPAAGYCATVQVDARTQQCREGPTPAGGAYSIGTYLDEDRQPVAREEAVWVDIVEYDAEGEEIMSTLGRLN